MAVFRLLPLFCENTYFFSFTIIGKDKIIIYKHLLFSILAGLVFLINFVV